MIDSESTAVMPAPRRGPPPPPPGNQRAVGHGAPRGNQNSVGHGAPLGNQNSLKTGLHSNRLPAGCGAIARRVQVLTDQLQSEIAERNGGEISLFHAALIQSATRHEQRVQLLYRLLRQRYESLEPTETAQLLRDIGKATTDRDACLKQLGLNTPLKSDDWAALKQQADNGNCDEAEPAADGDEPGEVSG